MSQRTRLSLALAGALVGLGAPRARAQDGREAEPKGGPRAADPTKAARPADPRRPDEGRQEERLAALCAQLKQPEGFRAVYKLVDAGPRAVNDLLSILGSSPLGDERVELCLREIARTRDGAAAEIVCLGQALRPLTRARLARALAQAGAADAIYPIVAALDEVQEPLELSTFGPSGLKARDVQRLTHPVSAAATLFGEKAALAVRKRLAKTTSAQFRVEAAWVLGSLKSVASVPDLVAIASNEERTAGERSMALQALTAIGNPAARESFVKALLSESPSVRRAGARGLAVAPDPSALPELARLLDEEKEEELKVDYVRALGALEDPLAAAPLVATLDASARVGESTRVPLAIACARALGATGQRDATAALVRGLGLGLGFPVDRALAQSLAKIPDLGIDPREALRTLVDAKGPPIPRACAAWTLALRGEDGPLAALLDLGKSNDWPVRAAVATLLGEGKLDGAVPVLLRLSQDDDANVRRAVATALGKTDDSTAGAALVKAALELDKDATVRRLYALAFLDALPQGTLDKEQQKLACPLLARALETELPGATLEERRVEAQVLARLGDRPALLRLATQTLSSAVVPVDSRRAAIELLALMGRHEATDAALAATLRDPAVGDDAALALARLRGETFFEPSWRALLAPPTPFH